MPLLILLAALLFRSSIRRNDQSRRSTWSQLSCPLLALFGEEDPNPSPAHAARLQEELDRHGKIYEFRMYRNTGHAFFADYRPSYRAAAAQDMWHRVLDFTRSTSRHNSCFGVASPGGPEGPPSPYSRYERCHRPGASRVDRIMCNHAPERVSLRSG